MKQSTSLIQKILLILLGLFIAFIAGEALFRVGGLIANKKIIQPFLKDKNTFTVLCIGDSSTYGLGASNIRKFSYPGQLQSILNERSKDKTFEVINLGLPGINSSQVLHRLKKYISDYQPDILIVMVGINDPLNLEESNIMHYYNKNALSKLFLGIEVMLDRLRVIRFLKLTLLPLIYSNPEENKQINTTFPANPDTAGYNWDEKHEIPDAAKLLAIYYTLNENIIKIVQTALDNNVNIMLMRYHIQGWFRMSSMINHIYSQFDIPIVDNGSLFERAEKKGLQVIWKDRWHPNDLGYSLIARNIYNKMVSLELVKGEPVRLF